MTRRITTVAVSAVAVLSLAASATAGPSRHSSVSNATLAPVNPAATTAGVAGVRGKAQLVDGRRNKVNLHMRGLAANTTYVWHVHVGSCAATGAPLAGWIYRTHDSAGNGTLTTNHAGNANTKARAATFDADPTKTYSVNVHVAAPTNGLAANTIIACGDLKPHHVHGNTKPGGPKHDHGRH